MSIIKAWVCSARWRRCRRGLASIDRFCVEPGWTGPLRTFDFDWCRRLRMIWSTKIKKKKTRKRIGMGCLNQRPRPSLFCADLTQLRRPTESTDDDDDEQICRHPVETHDGGADDGAQNWINPKWLAVGRPMRARWRRTRPSYKTAACWFARRHRSIGLDWIGLSQCNQPN